MSTRRYNLSHIRTFLTQGFSAEELRILCYDDPDLYPALEQLGDGMGKVQVVSRIIEFCQQRLLLDRLLEAARRVNPARYEEHQPYELPSRPRSSVPGKTDARTSDSPRIAAPLTGNTMPSTDARTEARKTRRLKVFLCHADENKPTVRDLYQRLRASGADPWLDEIALLPGQDWQLEIGRAVRQADIVLVCLSNRSVSKTGYVQKEIRKVLDLADYRPEGTIFVIPVRFEDCTVPERLSRWQWVDLFESGGYERLVRALQAQAARLEGVQPLRENA